MKILVTGASGFIGNNIAEYYKDHDLYVNHRDNENPKKYGKIISKDYQDIDFDSTFRDLDVIFHQAAISDTLVQDKNLLYKENCYDAIEFFKKALDHGCKKIVYASSCSVYGKTPSPHKENGPFNPLNYYAESKLLLDDQVSNLNSDKIIGLRYSNVYGGNTENHKKHSQSMVTQIINKIKNKEIVRLFHPGDQRRDFVYIKDIIKINESASFSKIGGIFNAGSGKNASFNEIVEIIGKNLNLEYKIEYIDNNIINKYQDNTLCDMSLLKEKLNFIPQFDVELGIKDLL